MDVHGVRDVCVGDGEGVHAVLQAGADDAGGVFGNRLFRHHVFDGVAVVEDGELAPLVLPAVAGLEGHGVADEGAVGRQGHFDGVGALAVLVVVVNPDFGDMDVHGVGDMSVGDDKSQGFGSGGLRFRAAFTTKIRGNRFGRFYDVVAGCIAVRYDDLRNPVFNTVANCFENRH